MTIQDLQAKWRDATLKARTAAQGHITDLCRALDVPTPVQLGPAGVDKDTILTRLLALNLERAADGHRPG